jgi:uncharacterized damage-inducible protein DinB
MSRPELSSIPSFYHSYFHLVKEDDILNALNGNTEKTISFLNSIPTNKWDYSYAEGKWTIKELVQHIIDSERIFSYRALRFARKDKTPLAGFDENLFAPASKANRRSKDELIKEFEAVRRATYLLYKSLDEEQLNYTGVANNNTISVKAIGFVTVGHEVHHRNILQERYLK